MDEITYCNCNCEDCVAGSHCSELSFGCEAKKPKTAIEERLWNDEMLAAIQETSRWTEDLNVIEIPNEKQPAEY